MSNETARLPRENLIRAVLPGVELRAADPSANDGAGMPTLFGNFLVFNRWTEINSMWEGNFMERFAPGSVKKTIREQRDKMRVLFQHGQDPQIGDKPLGPINDLRETDDGAYYEVPLLDTSYNRDLLPGLEAGLYGASFRFQVMREEVNENPEPSADNPKGLPERTVKEARVAEFGPVTFPAYADASAGVRSLTDDFIMSCIRSNPERLRDMFEQATSLREKDAPSEDDAETDDVSHLADERRETHAPKPHKPGREHIYGTRRKEQPSWLL